MTISRIISLPLYLYCVIWAVLHLGGGYVLGIGGGLLLAVFCIWAPDVVNAYTLGLWVDGYQIENATPEWMIALGGWLALGGAFVMMTWPNAVDAFLRGMLK